MSMSALYSPEEDLLELSFDGNLDLTVTHEICRIATQLRDGLKTCIMDLTRVDRTFDSGIALLRKLSGDLHRAGATVVVLADHPDVRGRLSLIQVDATYPSRRHLTATTGGRLIGPSGGSMDPRPTDGCRLVPMPLGPSL